MQPDLTTAINIASIGKGVKDNADWSRTSRHADRSTIRVNQLATAVSNAEKAMIQEAAKKRDLSISHFVRSTVLAAARELAAA